jgi:hypothetical protein
MVYGVERWKFLIPDKNLSLADIPKVDFPAPKSQWWEVEFKDGVKTIFTPTLRLASNQNHPAINAGYSIMANVATIMSKTAEPHPIKLIFTVLPTKELVYARKVQQEQLPIPEDYRQLAVLENQNITELAEKLRALPNAVYVDVVTPLQSSALTKDSLYPTNNDGHPISDGYAIIANVLAEKIQLLVPEKPKGLVAVQTQNNDYQIALIRNQHKWYFKDKTVLMGNGWNIEDIPLLKPRDLAGYRFNGIIDSIDTDKFGPSLN